MNRNLILLAGIGFASFGTCLSNASAALLVDLNSGSDTTAASDDFNTALGLSSGPTYTDIHNSSVTTMTIGANGTPGPFTTAGITISSSAGAFSYNGYLSQVLSDRGFTQNNPASYTDTISGVSLQPNQDYSLYVFVDNVIGGSGQLSLTDGTTTSATGTFASGDYAELDFNSGASPTGVFTLSFTGDGSVYTGFGAFAVVAATPEPASLALMSIAGLGLLARRRRVR